MNIKNKKGFLLRDFIVVGIIFGLTISLYIIQVASIADNYDNTNIIDEDFAAHYDKLQSMKSNLDTSAKAVQDPEGGLDLVGAFNVAFNSVFTVIVMVWDGLSLYAGMATNLASDFSFLDKNVIIIFTTGLIAILTAYLIFVWLSSVTRGKI
jgi:hypothetical protein